jgi:hypothetical protein
MIKIKDRFNFAEENKFGVEAADIVTAITTDATVLEALVDAIVADEALVQKISDAIDALPPA